MLFWGWVIAFAIMGIPPISLMKIVAVLWLLLTFFLGWWAKKNKHISLHLCLLVGGNLLCCTSILLPLRVSVQTILVDMGIALYVLSVLSLFIIPFFSKRRMGDR
jgi:hypothetical protein